MRGVKKRCVFEDWGFHRREQEMVESAPLLGLSQSAQVFGHFWIIKKEDLICSKTHK